MKKWIMIAVFALGAAAVQAATQNNVYDGKAGDSNFNNDTNWWNSVDSSDIAFFRGDNIAANPSRSNVNLSVDTTISGIKFQNGAVGVSAASYRIGGSNVLTLDGSVESNQVLIETLASMNLDQTIASAVKFKAIGNANNISVRTGTGTGTLTFAGAISQDAGSNGLGIQLGAGDIEISGNVNGSSKLWKIHDTTGNGVLRITGSGTWSNAGTVQINTGAGVLLNRSTTDSSGFAPGVLQMLGGSLTLGNNEQIANAVDLAFGAASGLFDLAGYEETMDGIKFVNGTHAGTIEMGAGGVLRLANQDSADVWGALTITGWTSGEDHIYVDGGSFSASQLAGITFDGWDSGAKVESGKLLPSTIPEPATIGMLGLGALITLFIRRYRHS